MFVVFFYVYFSSIDVFEIVVDYVYSYESWEFDEIILVVVLFGFIGFIFGVWWFI